MVERREPWQRLVELARTREILTDAADWAAWEAEMAEMDSAVYAYWEGETR